MGKITAKAHSAPALSNIFAGMPDVFQKVCQASLANDVLTNRCLAVFCGRRAKYRLAMRVI
jgi:hypothetical protein